MICTHVARTSFYRKKPAKFTISFDTCSLIQSKKQFSSFPFRSRSPGQGYFFLILREKEREGETQFSPAANWLGNDFFFYHWCLRDLEEQQIHKYFCPKIFASFSPEASFFPSDKKWEKNGRRAGKNDRLLRLIFFSLACTCRVVATTTVLK